MRGKSGEWTGRVVVLLFVVQTLLLGFTVSASAELLPRDQFGNVLCAEFGAPGEHGSHDKPAGHSGVPDCCSMGCTMFGGPVPSPSLLSSIVRQPVLLDEPFTLFEGVGSGAVETPRNTRGPPRLG